MSTTITRSDSLPMEKALTAEPDDMTRRALALYESKLKAKLEPEHNNQFIAIEPDSEAYAIADSSGNAMRAMHKTYPDKPVLLMKIGPEPEYDLAIRILGAQALAKVRQK